RRSRPVVAWLATSSLVAIAAEGAIGGVVVANELAPWLVLVHLGLAMIILGCLLATAILALPASPGLPDRVKPFAAALGTYVLLLTGSTVVASEADETCRAWPLCGGGLAFDLSGANAFTMLHRGAVLAIGALMVYALWAAMRRAELRPGDGDAGRPPPPGRGRRGGGAHRRRALQRPARRDRDPRLGGHAGDRAAHAAARGPLARARPAQRGQTAGMSVLRDYLSLLKLRVVLLLDATAVGVMIPAAHGRPSWPAMLAVLVGGTFAAGGAHALNCWFDRDIDAEMNRTRRRPLRPDGAGALRRRLLLDPAPLLGAGPTPEERLRASARADAAGGRRRPVGQTPEPGLRGAHGRGEPGPVLHGLGRAGLPCGGHRAGRRAGRHLHPRPGEARLDA